MWTRCAAVIAAWIAAGCDDHLIGVPLGEVVDEPAYACDWSGVERFLLDHCAACHSRKASGDIGSGGVELIETIEAEAAAESPPPNALVVPGAPEASVLWQSVSGTGPALLMPYGYTEPLPEHQIEHIACWILDGAPL